MIKAIIFDFGNVLYDLNYDLFLDNFTALLQEEVRDGFPKDLQKAMDDYETGSINTETFIWNFQHHMKGNLQALDIINCWNSLLDQFPPHRWDFLGDLAQKYKLFLLSNINDLHLTTAYRHISKVHGRVDFETKFFNAVFYSHIIGLSKPDPKIYEFVQNGLGLQGSEIVFIDDREENISAARKAGWNAFLHDPANDIVDVFDHYLKKL